MLFQEPTQDSHCTESLFLSHLAVCDRFSVSPPFMSLTPLRILISYFMDCPLIWVCLLFSHDYTEVTHLGQKYPGNDVVLWVRLLMGFTTVLCLLTGDVDHDRLVKVVSPLQSYYLFFPFMVNKYVEGIYLKPCKFCQRFLKKWLAPLFTSLLTFLKNSKRLGWSDFPLLSLSCEHFVTAESSLSTKWGATTRKRLSATRKRALTRT